MCLRKLFIGTYAFIASLATSGWVGAAEQCDADMLSAAAMLSPVKLQPATVAAHDPVFGSPLKNARLEAQRGGQDLVVNDQKLKATVTDNVASNLTTGNNVISEGAFAGTNGLPMVIQNSGNNVSIQNSTILNLNLK
jgi:hypothetical protein